MKITFDDRAMVILETAKPALLIADVHLGRHIDIDQRAGVRFPPQHQSIFARIERLITKYHIKIIYIIGDLKHSIGADSPYNWEFIPAFVKKLQYLSEVIVIPGNHDGDLHALLPRQTIIADIHGIIVNKETPYVAALHGHTWPSERVLLADIIVVGHNHPSIGITRTAKVPTRHTIKRSGGALPVIIKSHLDKNCVRQYLDIPESDTDRDGVLIILPSFNVLSIGNRINLPDASFQGPLLERGCAKMQDAEVFSIDGIYLGTIKTLNESTK